MKSKTARTPILSPEDSDLLAYTWYANPAGYLYRSTWDKSTKRRGMRCLHREIMSRVKNRSLLRKEVVDHLNGNKSDNRRENMRLVSQSENNANRTQHDRRNKSGHRGVVWHKQRGKWAAQATYRGRHISLGLFDRVEEAAIAADAWRKEHMLGYRGPVPC
jgi:AP2 domain/HNH endonuclease